MTKTLELVFKNAEGSKKVLSLADPKDDLTLSEAQEAAQKIIAANIFTTSGGDLVSLAEARVVTKGVEELV